VKEGERGCSHEVFSVCACGCGLLRYRMGWEFSCDFFFWILWIPNCPYSDLSAFSVTDVNIVSYLLTQQEDVMAAHDW
jgi:hypothetical protein